MADGMTPSTSDRERALGITPVDDLLEAYLDTTAEIAPLRARHGTNGTFEHERKALLAKLRIGIRRAALTPTARVTAGRLTDAAIDDLAHAHPEYLTFLETCRVEKAAMHRMEGDLVRSGMVANRHNLLLRLETADRVNMPRSSGTCE